MCTDCNNMLRARALDFRAQPVHTTHGNDHRTASAATVYRTDVSAGDDRGAGPSFEPQDDSAKPLLMDVHASSSSDDDDDDDVDDDDTSVDDDTDASDESERVNVSSAVAGVLSSWDERKTNSISFLAALQGNLVESNAPNVLSVLLFPNEKCYCVNVVTVTDEETLQQLASRMAEHFFKLSHGPFMPFDDSAREALLPTLRFSTELHPVDMSTRALDLASQKRHIVLSTLTLDELQKSSGQLSGSAVSSLRDFFNSEQRRPYCDDELVS